MKVSTTTTQSIQSVQGSAAAATAKSINIDTYLDLLMHALYCTKSSCTNSKCGTMKRVILHSKQCMKRKTNECEYCRQLIALCIYHAKSCKEESAFCQVPFCGSIKIKLNIQNELKARLGSVHDVIEANLSLLNCKPATEAETQTGAEEPASSSRTIEQSVHCIESDRSKLIEEIQHAQEAARSSNSAGGGYKFDKKFRYEIIKQTVKQLMGKYDLTVDQNCKNLNYALLVKYIFNRERELNREARHSDDYLLLITDMFAQFEGQLKLNKRKSQHVQANECEPDADCDSAYPASKRIRTH